MSAQHTPTPLQAALERLEKARDAYDVANRRAFLVALSGGGIQSSSIYEAESDAWDELQAARAALKSAKEAGNG